ncbi:MAG: AraC family transcriptional regulator [Acidimicrobiia bacterium]
MTGVPTAAEVPPVLASALEQLRLDGAIFFRSELRDPFAIDSTPNRVAGQLHPDAERVLLFHIVVRGRCWVSGPDGERHVAEAGDVIVVPYGDDHTIGGDTPAECMSVLTLLDPPPWETIPIVEWGGGGPTTSLVCGYLVSDDPLFDPAMRVFSPVFVVRLPDAASARWVEASVHYAMQEGLPTDSDPAAGAVAATRLPELVLIEVLKAHLATAPAADDGWIAALRDPVLAPALAMLHGEPERHWTVTDIAAGAAVSRSALDERFRQVLGRSPIRYLAEWRMHLAEELLATTDVTVFALARRVGYDSEEAFSRAFKRARGASPSHWRAAHRGR